MAKNSKRATKKKWITEYGTVEALEQMEGMTETAEAIREQKGLRIILATYKKELRTKFHKAPEKVILSQVAELKKLLTTKTPEHLYGHKFSTRG